MNANINDIRQVYHILNACSLNECKDKITSSNFCSTEQLDQVEVVHKVANQVDQKKWENWVLNNELPAVQLSKQEMNVLNGGIFPAVAFGFLMLIAVNIYVNSCSKCYSPIPGDNDASMPIDTSDDNLF